MESCSWPCGGGPCDFGVTPESKSLFLFFFEGLCWFLVGALDSGLTIVVGSDKVRQGLMFKLMSELEILLSC